MSAFHDNALLGASGQQGYKISRSVRLRQSASAYFNRTFTTPTNQKKWTLSCWVKRGALSSTGDIFNGAQSGTNDNYIRFVGSNALMMGSYNGAGTDYGIVTTAVFRDPSAWYHCVFVYDVDNATAADRAIIYVNNVRQAVSNNGNGMFPSGYASASWNTAVSHRIGSNAPSAIYSDQYLTEMVFVDGQALTPSSFGETDTATGVWKPKKYKGTYGTNGFYLNFSDNSSNTATTIGKDYSGNGNNWTPNNISVTAGVTYDSMVDSPTVGATSSNYCTLNPLAANSAVTAAQGNLSYTASNDRIIKSTISVTSGKWYWEFAPGGGGSTSGCGVINPSVNIYAVVNLNIATAGVSYLGNGNKSVNGTASSYGATYTSGNIIGVALDLDSNTVTFYKDNTSQGSISITSGLEWCPAFDQNTGTNYVNFGQRPFSYTPPTGFVALNTQNLPTPTISNGANYMAATTYTGTGSSLTIANTVNGISFYPDFVWVKGRSGATDHALYDSVRGTTKDLVSNSTAAETTQATGLTAFGSTGFTVGALAKMNTNAATYVGWQWLAGAGSSSSNTSGSITSTVSAGATQGFSVVTFTGNYNGSTGTGTVGHGLGVAPKMIIVKNRSQAFDWGVGHTSIGWTQAGNLNLTNAFGSSAYFNNTAPTSSVFSVGLSNISNQNGSSIVAYCFAEVAGYSKFGSYTGNGSADGPFVYCGFRPRWIMIKRTDTSGTNWHILDSARDAYNASGLQLYANLSAADDDYRSSNPTDFLSNGFKSRNTLSGANASGGTYIYMAFAENPFKNSLAR